MTTNPVELLESFQKELTNEGYWYWTDVKNGNGTRARILTAMQKMLKAKMDEADVKDIIIELMLAGYVEYSKQVKSKVGLSIIELMDQQREKISTEKKTIIQEIKKDEHACASVGVV